MVLPGQAYGTGRIVSLRQELGHDTGDEDVVLVDVGGGRGQVLVDVHEHLPNLKGRLVLEDLPVTFTDFEAPRGIELVQYNFFEPQPIVGECPFSISGEPSAVLRICRSTRLCLPSHHARLA